MLLGMMTALVAAEPEAAGEGERPRDDDIISLAAYNVKADRIEDFGLRIDSETYSGKQANLATMWFATYAPRISAVLPNTAAARAGLQPGERILKAEGRSTVGSLFVTGNLGQWGKTQKKKWAEVAAGKKNVALTLEVESPVTKAVRTVKLVVPTPPPHWGSAVWQKPEGRSPARVEETGPLAERCRELIDHGIWGMVACGLVAPRILEIYFGRKIPPDEVPTGYEWHVGNWSEGSHQMMVTQFRGRTEILLHANKARDYRVYLTSPSGVLAKAWQWGRGKPFELSAEEARAGFEHEVDLWANQIVRGTGRWPFEVKESYDANAIFAVLAAKDGKPAAKIPRPLAAEFLKLRPATEAERALFTEAHGKLGADHEQWAYTETSRGLEDKRVLVTRVDPSKPEGERRVLLSIDGQAPTPAEVQQWREDGGDTVKPLGDIPPLAGLVDLRDLRVFKDEAAATVFELPSRSDDAEFPAEKVQALFRVNKTSRTFEEINVKLRDTFRVAGVLKVTDAGLAMRFQTFDPVLAPQPVLLKMGGGVRVLLVKLSRSFETTRTDYVRVVAFEEAVMSAK